MKLSQPRDTSLQNSRIETLKQPYAVRLSDTFAACSPSNVKKATLHNIMGLTLGAICLIGMVVGTGYYWQSLPHRGDAYFAAKYEAKEQGQWATQQAATLALASKGGQP